MKFYYNTTFVPSDIQEPYKKLFVLVLESLSIGLLFSKETKVACDKSVMITSLLSKPSDGADTILQLSPEYLKNTRADIGK